EGDDLLADESIEVGLADGRQIAEGADLLTHLEGVGVGFFLAAPGELLQHVAPALVGDELHRAAVELEMGVEVLEQRVPAADLVLLGIGEALLPRLLLELVVLGTAAVAGL